MNQDSRCFMIDLHNHNIDHRVDIVANPLNPKRKNGIVQKSRGIDKTKHLEVEAVDMLVRDLENQMKIVDTKNC